MVDGFVIVLLLCIFVGSLLFRSEDRDKSPDKMRDRWFHRVASGNDANYRLDDNGDIVRRRTI